MIILIALYLLELVGVVIFHKQIVIIVDKLYDYKEKRKIREKIMENTKWQKKDY